MEIERGLKVDMEEYVPLLVKIVYWGGALGQNINPCLNRLLEGCSIYIGGALYIIIKYPVYLKIECVSPYVCILVADSYELQWTATSLSLFVFSLSLKFKKLCIKTLKIINMYNLSV